MPLETDYYYALKVCRDIAMANLFCPEKTGKKGSTRGITSNGIVTPGDPAGATKKQGESNVLPYIAEAVRFIKEGREIN